MNPALQVALVAFSMLGSVIGALTLFIVSDLRSRIVRLENRHLSAPEVV